MPARVANAQSSNAQFHGSLVDCFHVLGVRTRRVFGHKHDRNIVFHGVRDGFLHRGHQFLHRPTFRVLANGAGTEEGRGLDFHLVFCLHLHEGLNVAHEGSNGRTRPNGVIVFSNVREHGVDVISMMRTCPGQTEVDFLQTKLFHVAEEFDFLLDGGVSGTGALKSVAQRLVVKPHPVRMVCSVAFNLVLHGVPIVNQRTLVHQTSPPGRKPPARLRPRHHV